MDDTEFERLVTSARARTWGIDEVADLAQRLAASGERLDWPGVVVSDIASTGGPGSLSTLLAPLALRAHGLRVVKLAVSGRPAGAIDSLATLPGYRATSSSEQVRQAVTDCGYAHFLADHRFAPLDAALFAYRRREGAVAIPSLAAASLLAKKLAVGVHAVGLDVRVGQFGNFGTTLESARANARLFCRAAQKLGITATAFVSTQAAPAQPWIGRGESLLALAIVSGVLGEENAGDWLAQHAADCYSMAATVASSTTSLTSPASCPPAVISVRNELERHLFAHGSSIETLRVRAREVLKTRRTEITAPTAGIAHLEMGAIRDAIVDVQNDAATGKFQDPAGVELLVRSGSAVFAGQPLARLRCDDTTSIASFSDRIRSAVRIEPDVGNSPLGMPSSMEIVRA